MIGSLATQCGYGDCQQSLPSTGVEVISLIGIALTVLVVGAILRRCAQDAE